MKLTRCTIRDGVLITVGTSLVITGGGLMENPEHLLHGAQLLFAGLLVIVVSFLVGCKK